VSAPERSVERLAARLDEIAGAPVELERPKNAEHGDFATSVALRTAGGSGLAPRELATQLAGRMVELEEVVGADVAGPGFVNLRLADAFFVEALGEIDESYGGGFADPPAHVQVEMVSANPTGPVVVSAGRNGALGDSVARLLEFGGHQVEREYYYNDAGTQIERFRASVEALRRGEPIPEDGYRGDYVAELAGVDGDPVPRMLHSIETTMRRFRIHFDGWALQSALEQRLPDLLPRLDTYEKDGALWARSSAYGDEQDWVLVRSADRGGSPTYRAADVAYLVDKLERGYDRAIYVLGADHHATARWYAAIARMLGYDPERIEVLLYQFVHLTGGGASAKASKRAGNVVFLDELLDEVGVDAARWYLVNRGPDQTIDIDIDLAAEKSNKNPVFYVQYAHARIAGILRKAEGADEGGPPPGALAAEEKELIKRLTDFPATVREAADRRGPQLLPSYAIRVADDYHRFYTE
jgi:arginyl-tRNA synthetase